MAKALANGVPMGAMICQRKLQDVLTPGTHASTFGGTPFASAVAATVIDTILKDNLLENCRVQGDFLREGLQKLAEKHPMVKGVRGKGLMIGIEFADPDGTPRTDLALKIVDLMRNRGIILLPSGPWSQVVSLSPALVTPKACFDTFLEEFDDIVTHL